MKPSRIKYAVLHFGYVESYGLGSLVLHNKGPAFKTEKEAFESLAGDLLALFKTYHGYSDQEKACCVASAKKKFCPDCGRKIGVKKWDMEDFEQWVSDLVGQGLDGYGMLDTECERNVVWELGHSASALIGLKKDQAIYLDERADQEISKILKLENL